MGWFLTNSKKTKKKTKRGRSTDPSWDPSRTLLGVKFAGAGGLLLAVALGWHFGSEKLQAYVNDTHAQPITAEDIRFSDEPELMSPADINQLRAEIAQLIGDAPLNRKGLRETAQLLQAKPDIVRELRQVRRTPEGTVEIDLDFRTPAALVRMRNERTGALSDDGYHVIDDMGFQMYGPRTLAEVEHLGLRQIVGVSSKYRPKDNLGEHRWQGPEVDAALALLAELRKSPAIDLIDSVSVNITDERGRIRLVLNTLVIPARGAEAVPCRIVWGLPPGQERTIEPDADRKLAALIATLSDSRYRMGHWQEVWVNTGNVRPAKAIGSGNRQWRVGSGE